jgi:NADPH:quinone reductase-like Zn-dependent oxidoreductase
VIATGSQASADLLRQLGTDVFVDYTKDRLEDVVQGVDGVLDTIGGVTGTAGLAVLRPGGVLVSIGSPVV